MISYIIHTKGRTTNRSTDLKQKKHEDAAFTCIDAALADEGEG